MTRSRTAMMLALLALASGFSAPAMAQVRPIPAPKPPLAPAPSPSPVPKPTAPRLPPQTGAPRTITINPRPQITIAPNPVPDHRIAGLTVSLTGLGDAQAVHLFGFEPGCDFAQTPVSNNPMRRDITDSSRAGARSTVSYTTDASAGRISAIQLPGLPVVNGSAKLSIFGRVGGSIRLSPREETTGIPDEAPPTIARYTTNSLATGSPRTCEPRAVLMVQGADGIWRNLRPDGSLALAQEVGAEVVKGVPWRTIGGARVTHTRTTNSRDALNPRFSFVRPGSVCSGVSRTPAGEFPVGILEVEGDLVFRIRSGPVGTHCRLELPGRSLEDGTRLTLRFSASKVGDKCRIGAPAGFGLPGGFVLDRADQFVLGPRRLTETGAVMLSWAGWIDPFVNGGGGRLQHRTVMQEAHIDLYCEPTALNDHGIEIRFDEIEYMLPNGGRVPQ